MALIWTILQLLAAGLTLLLTAVGVWQFRKPRPLKIGRLLTAALLSLGLLVFYLLVGGLQISWLVGSLAFLFGLILGVLSGLTTQMMRQGNQVIGRNSILALLLWGGSYAFSMLLNLSPSLLVVALGLLPLFLSSGLQLGNQATLLARRLAM
jgi:hypothetical protein